jgi:hypothetical protein
MTDHREPSAPGGEPHGTASGPPRPPRSPLGEGRHKVGSSAGVWAGVGLQFAATILVFVFIGQWLDRRFGTDWLTIVAVLLGFAGGTYSMYRRATAEQRREDEARQAQGGGSGGPRP